MSLTAVMPRLSLVLLLVGTSMITAGRWNLPAVSLAAAHVAAIAVALSAWLINRPPRDPIQTPRRNARLQALLFGWGGLTLLAGYSLAGLKWQHGWQYGTGLSVLAVLTFGLALRLGQEAARRGVPWRPRVVLAVIAVEGLAAIGGLVWMVAVGKLADTKMSFLAHHVLWGGGLALIAATAFSAAGELRRAHRPAACTT